MNDRAVIAAVAALSIATTAVGLRVGAGESVRAAILVGAPLARGGGHAALQLRTQEDDGRTRSAVSTRFSATLRAKGAARTFSGATNADGVAEIELDAPGLADGDPIDVDVTDGRGGVLARGCARWPAEIPRPTIVEHEAVRPSRDEGAIRMRVAILDAALAPGEAGRAWVTTSASTEPPRDVHIEATPDLGLDVASPFRPSTDPSCARSGSLELVARGMSGSLALHARDALGREGDWYGAIPVAPGAMHVETAHVAPLGPLHVAVTSASARTMAYVELDDDAGRGAARAMQLAGDPPRGETTFELRAPGRHFLVVSGEPDGAKRIAGATRALPIWAGPNAPCEADLAELAATAFPRFTMLDGFEAEHARLAHRKRKGRFIALTALALGSFLETLLLLRAARDGRRRLERLQNALLEEDDASATKRIGSRGPLDVVVVLGMSLLGFALLFALVAAFASK